MTKKKVRTRDGQIKLVFQKGEPGSFCLDEMMKELQIEFHAFASSAGVLVMQAMMEQEVKSLAGERYQHQTEIDRWGNQRGSVVIGGQRVGVQRPRLRSKGKEEVPLASYERFHGATERTREVYEHLVSGISCRKYGEVIEAIQDGYGISRSVVSREMKAATSQQLQALCERDLSGFELCVVVIDGIHVGESVQIVALGVDSGGKKQVLGFREGATENAQVCIELFEDLVQRKLRLDRAVMALIDGSKGLRAAVKRFMGEGAMVQRCQYHKLENVLDHLPKKYHVEYRRKIKAAYAMHTHEDAHQALEKVKNELARINESAAGSLAEGMEETLTVHRLGLPQILRNSFSTTNLIESTFSSGRRVIRNVTRWRNSNQIQRWTAAGLIEAEKHFRRVRGYKSMSVLIAALENDLMKERLDKERMVA